MSSLPPGKMKAYLSTVKETFLDKPPPGGALGDSFLGVLKMELFLRGILVEDEKKIWSQIQASVGKSLLVEQSASKIPKALLAGANVIAGRVVEAFYNKLTTAASLQSGRDVNGSSNSDFLRHLVPDEETSGARQRAEDIQDERWLFLLLHRKRQSPTGDDVTFEDYTNGLLQVALGCYTTAALIQSDTPPMWKKLWDVWTLLEKAASLSDNDASNKSDVYPPFEAQVAIENLIRIALSKNNAKRASELQLRLVQSYLNPNRIALVEVSLVSTQKRKAGTTSITIAECFGDSMTNDILPSKNDKASEDLVLAERARSTLETSQSHFEHEAKTQQGGDSLVTPSSDLMLYQILQVQTLLAQDDGNIQQQAQEMCRRSTIQINLADCIEKCRTSLVLSSYDSSNESLLEQAKILRDMTIASWSSAAVYLDAGKESTLFARLSDINNLLLSFHWVAQSILRLKERAEIISRNKSSQHEPWNELLEFIRPILKEMERQITQLTTANVVENESKERVYIGMEWLNQILGESNDVDSNRNSYALMKLIDIVVSILPNVLWMLFGADGKSINPLDQEMNLAIDIVSALIQWHEKAELERRRRAKDTPTVGSKNSRGAISTVQWQQVKASAMCFTCQDNDAVICQITSDAISNLKNKETRGFLPFLQCMVAWSGWFQNPWPFCSNLGDARRLVANAELDLGRPLTKLEQILLQLAKADAELLNGGFMQHANEHYISVIAQLQEKDCFIDKHCASLLLAHCYNGMARIEHADQQYTDYNVAEESCTKKSLEILENLDLPSVIPSLSIWNLRSTFISSKTHALSVTRQLIADSLIHFERFGEARSFLQKAVADSPLDCEAALALGAFLLRVTFYLSKERSVEKAKEAQVHLLKAAKLDPSKPNPFALLGIWYEESKDLKRALGCYMKSLKLEPCNPVAGRGLLRLSPSENNRFFLESAINKSSPFNGWAWCAVGRGKAYSDGDDGLAVVAILKALRCRDIAFPDKESLGLFYNNPSFQVENEKSAALAEVGMCYRRLGRMTASIRAFRASIEAVGLKSVQSATLISCAQVEQELGLFDEAAEKFAIVIGREENTSRSVALYGHSMALFSIAERDLMDGKAGAAFARIELAVENCLNSSILSGCEYKLLGDLYSFGASFPANVFCDDNSKILDVNLLIEKQLEFVSKGEEAFRSCLSAQSHFYSDDEEGIATKSSILSDIASNILLQGQLLSPLGSNNQKVNDKYSIAAEAFRQAIEYNPIHAASWCGLGCSVRKTDPLLAQHAFSRCVQIESMCPDAYANAGFLYTSRLAFRASRSTMEALTQVADTPMMWMNCAFVLEREAEKSLVGENEGKSEDFISQAADAYRASLQVMRHPEAQLGLSLTGRVVPSHKQIKNDVPLSRLSALKRRDSFSFMKEYLDASLNEIGPALIFQGVMSMEKGLSGPSHEAWQNEIYMEGKEKTRLTQTNPRIFEISLSGPSGQKLEASIKTLMAEEEKTRGAFTVSANEVNQVNLQREIWLQPDRADLWLSLAKSFIEDGAVESAKTAASRAADILSSELMTSSQTSVKSLPYVNSEIISEALSLRCWLGEIQKTCVSSIDTQRALFMNPTNAVARQSIVFEANATSARN